MKLGAQLYTIRQFTKTPEDIEKSLRKIKAQGFDVIQISGFGPMDPHKLGDLVHELEFDVCVTHNPYDRFVNDLDNLIEEHRLLGCDTIGLGSMPAQFRTGKEGAEAFIKEFNEISKKIADAGMKFGYHNHDFEFERVDGRLIMDMLIEDTVPEFGFILDTFWLQSGGVSPMDYIKRVDGRMKVCHFKDMKIVRDEKFPPQDRPDLYRSRHRQPASGFLHEGLYGYQRFSRCYRAGYLRDRSFRQPGYQLREPEEDRSRCSCSLIH